MIIFSSLSRTSDLLLQFQNITMPPIPDTSATPVQMTGLGFLDLPPEIRLQVYQYLFSNVFVPFDIAEGFYTRRLRSAGKVKDVRATEDEYSALNALLHQPFTMSWEKEPMEKHLRACSMLRVSKLVHDESRAVLLDRTIFEADVVPYRRPYLRGHGREEVFGLCSGGAYIVTGLLRLPPFSDLQNVCLTMLLNLDNFTTKRYLGAFTKRIKHLSRLLLDGSFSGSLLLAIDVCGIWDQFSPMLRAPLEKVLIDMKTGSDWHVVARHGHGVRATDRHQAEHIIQAINGSYNLKVL